MEYDLVYSLPHTQSKGSCNSVLLFSFYNIACIFHVNNLFTI